MANSQARSIRGIGPLLKFGISTTAIALSLWASQAGAQVTATPAQIAEPAADTPTGDTEASQDIVVTGSRVATNGADAPTPVTTVSSVQLLQTTPSTIPDALNKLPVFLGSQRPRSPGAGGTAQGSNVLALRNFGAQRTLVLLDNHRITPTNANGSVNADTLPQLLIQRVDVVTGGASAVYGSDAVTGVVNFVLDKKLEGLKFDVNSGISTYGDGFSYRLGSAYGTRLFGGRGHLLLSAQHFEQKPVENFNRPYGDDIYVLTGSGTVANPFVVNRDVRRADSAFGGKVHTCVAPCPALGQQFVGTGVLGPFAPGRTTGTANQNVGGDGAYSVFSTALVSQRTDDVFGRFSYDLTDDINFYAQSFYAELFTEGRHFPAKLTPTNGAPTVSNSTAGVFFKNNPFLPAAAQAALGNNGRFDNSNVFSVGTYFIDQGREGTVGATNFNRHLEVQTGLTGTLGRFSWDLFLSHGVNKLRVSNLNNSDYQKQFAAMDAVVGANGQIQCYAAAQAATASQYAGCVPLNGFGPQATTDAMFAYFTATTTFQIINKMDNVSGSVSGDLFEGWAGPVRAALSGEARWNSYDVSSNASPTELVNCTGLRICNPALPRWAQPVIAEVRAKQNVWEIAGEFEAPLLRDVTLFKSLTLNAAGRYTDYSTSGDVRTWKVGTIWDLVEGLRFRGAVSQDIRAPTLDDLFRPLTGAVTGFVDIHTQTSATLFQVSSGNPDLVPEKARTYTAGIVLQPSFLRGFSISADYYSIRLDNAIGQVSPTNNGVQQICEQSNGVDPYCALFERPLPFSDRTPANFPTRVFNLNLNTAVSKLRGWDFEAGYRTGPFSARVFVNYQPTNLTTNFVGQPPQTVATSKTRVTTFLNYDGEVFHVGIQNRWLSGYDRNIIPSTPQIYADPRQSSYTTTDLSVAADINVDGRKASMYFTVQNIFNMKGEVLPPTGSIGLQYPVPTAYDIMGRYFTVGLRGRF